MSESLAEKLSTCPTFLQMEETECGAACLAMVLGHFGSYVPLEEVRIAAGVSRDGSNALSIARAARYYGLEAHGYSIGVDGLLGLAGPAIVFWRRRHYLVVEGHRRGKWYVNDPSTGRYTLTDEEFAAGYSEVALVFAPGDDFVARKGARQRFARTLLQPLHASVAGVVFALLAGFLLVVPTLILAFLAGSFVQNVLAEGRDDLLVPILFGIAGSLIATLLLTVMQQYVLLRVQAKLSIKMSTEFIWHMLRVPVEFFHERYSGTLVSRVQINSQIAQLLSGTSATTIIFLFTMLAYGVTMVALSPPLAVVAILFALANAAAVRLAARRRVEGNASVLKQLTKVGGVAYHGLNTIDSIKARGGEDEFFTSWSGTQADYLNAQQRLGVPTALLNVVPTLVALLNTLAVLAIGGWLVIDGRLGISQLVSFQIIAASFLGPVAQLSSVAEQIQTAHGQVQQLQDVLSYDVDPATARGDDDDHLTGHRLDGHLELRDVTFGYSPTGAPLIEGLSLSVAPGGRIALVGRSGSGKSTIGNLVTGLYAPWSGEVLLDGRPRDLVPRSVVSSSVAHVDQRIFLFEASVLDNVRLWDDTVGRETVVEATQDASIHDVVLSRPGGFDAVVEEAGRNFSGGEAQRLEIARALATNPRILVLDEATSALDTATERAIDDALRRRGMTVIAISHRLSTVRDADEIIVLDHGRVTQRGTHDELIAVPGLYRELVDA